MIELRPLSLTIAGLALAFLLGTLIGTERQWRQRSAGLRTTTLVATGAAAFADMGLRLRGVEGATQIIAYVVSGIGFLGAGVILKDGTNIRGLNTAATLWCSAAVGAFAGSGLLAEAVALTAFVLAGNTLLRPLVNYINRRADRRTRHRGALHRPHRLRPRGRLGCARPAVRQAGGSQLSDPRNLHAVGKRGGDRTRRRPRALDGGARRTRCRDRTAQAVAGDQERHLDGGDHRLIIGPCRGAGQPARIVAAPSANTWHPSTMSSSFVFSA